MATEKRLPGVDIYATITLKKTDGTPYDLSTLVGYFLYVFLKPNKIIAQFCSETMTGYDEPYDTTDNAGIVKILIPGTKTKGISNQKLFVVAYIQTDDGGEAIHFGTKDGINYELVELTQGPVIVPPTIT